MHAVKISIHAICFSPGPHLKNTLSRRIYCPTHILLYNIHPWQIPPNDFHPPNPGGLQAFMDCPQKRVYGPTSDLLFFSLRQSILDRLLKHRLVLAVILGATQVDLDPLPHPWPAQGLERDHIPVGFQ